MKGHRTLALIAIAALAAAACDDTGDTTGVQNTCANLAGSFRATNFVVVGTSNTALNQNLLSNGATFTLTFNNGNFTSVFLPAAGGTSMSQSGAVTTSGENSITLGTQALFSGAATGTQAFNCILNGTTLLLMNPSTTFNFTGTGTTMSPAAITLTLTRNTT